MAKSDKWCCKNPGRKMLNIVKPAQIEEAAKEGRKPIFICDNCGFCEMDTEHSEDYLRDIPLEDWQRRLPTGTISDGTFVDIRESI